MKQVVMFNAVSLDGYFAGPNGEIDWFIPDPELEKEVHRVNRVNTTLLGRITYQMLESYWPPVLENPAASERERRTAEELDQMNKVVFSKTLQTVTWKNTRLLTSDLTGEVARLKLGNGDGIIIFGSGQIVQQLTNAGLIDDYFFAVTPVVIGGGKSLFKDADKLKLNLVSAKQYSSGNLLLHYKVG